MTYVKPDDVIKYDPSTTWVAECNEDILTGQPIYLDTNGKWNIASAAVSTCATHIALTDGSSTPTGVGNDTTKQLTGFTSGQVSLASALANKGGFVFLGDTAGRYSDVPGATSQRLGTLLDTNGKVLQVNIEPKNNNL